jgi:DNA polymerase-3 subunit beta
MSEPEQDVPDQSGSEDTHSLAEAGPSADTFDTEPPGKSGGTSSTTPPKFSSGGLIAGPDQVPVLVGPEEQVISKEQALQMAGTIEPEGDGTSPKFYAKKFSLQALLEKAGSVVPSRDVLAVLKNFLIEATPGKIRIAATDLELSIVVASEMVFVQRPGVAVFPAKKMLEIVREAEEGEIHIDVVDSKAHIKVGRASWTIQLQDGSEYPALPEDEGIERVAVARAAFLTAIMSVRHAAAKDTVRPSLMMLDISDGKVRAADGVRFQQVEVAGVPDMQIPINAVSDLVKILQSTEAPVVEIGQDDTSLIFRIGQDEFVAQKPTATYPDVDEVLLKPALANDQELHVDREELVGAIKRVRINADPETSAVVLELTKDLVTVRAKDKTGSTANEPVDAAWSHPDRTMSFNHVHLTELLNSLESKSAVLRFGADTKTRPTALLARDADQGMTALLNQLRLDWVG